MKIYCDFDGTIANTIKSITSLYNEDFQYYDGFNPVNWTDVNTWGFEECNCANCDEIDLYFNQKRFFDRLEYMDNAREILDILSKEHEIVVVSMGTSQNLKAKKIWIDENLPYAKFIGVDFKDANDKAHIDMSDGILIDDSVINLITSNARYKVCFGDKYPWNEGWDSVRCYNWYDVKKFTDMVRW